jgi:branched-chain amino acid transport system substrate-binding protein
VAELYQRRFGVAMSDAAAGVFTAMLTLAMAVDAAGPADPSGNSARVRAALRRVSLPATQTIMPWDGVRFDGSGQNQLAAAVVEQRAPGGFQVVYPREVATLPLMWRGH